MFLRRALTAAAAIAAAYVVIVVAATYLHHSNIDPVLIMGACVGLGISIGAAANGNW